jgi:hypothetical protein
VQTMRAAHELRVLTELWFHVPLRFSSRACGVGRRFCRRSSCPNRTRGCPRAPTSSKRAPSSTTTPRASPTSSAWAKNQSETFRRYAEILCPFPALLLCLFCRPHSRRQIMAEIFRNYGRIFPQSVLAMDKISAGISKLGKQVETEKQTENIHCLVESAKNR